jgi:hypothetical protein
MGKNHRLDFQSKVEKILGLCPILKIKDQKINTQLNWLLIVNRKGMWIDETLKEKWMMLRKEHIL